MTEPIAQIVITKLASKNLLIRCAESCTGGLIMAALTDVSGSSKVVDRGFVTYSNDAKRDLLGVNEQTLEIYGAVSAETAFEMVQGAQHKEPVAAISVTGIAGPNGGSDEKPVGTIWIGTAVPNKQTLVKSHFFSGNRQDIREQTVLAAFTQLLSLLD